MLSIDKRDIWLNKTFVLCKCHLFHHILPMMLMISPVALMCLTTIRHHGELPLTWGLSSSLTAYFGWKTGRKVSALLNSHSHNHMMICWLKRHQVFLKWLFFPAFVFLFQGSKLHFWEKKNSSRVEIQRPKYLINHSQPNVCLSGHNKNGIASLGYLQTPGHVCKDNAFPYTKTLLSPKVLGGAMCRGWQIS